MSDTCRRGHAEWCHRPNGWRRCRACERDRGRRRRGTDHEGHEVQQRRRIGAFCLTCWRGDHDVDEIAVDRAVSGDPPGDLTVAEREAAIADLTEAGFSASEIADRVGCTRRTVQRARKRMNESEAA